MLSVLARLGKFLAQSKILVLGVSFVALVLISALFAGRYNAENTDQSVKGIETVNTTRLSPTPTPILVKPENRLQSGSNRPLRYTVTNTSKITIYPTPTLPAQPEAAQKSQPELQEDSTPSPDQPETSTTRVSCTFSNGKFLCQ